MANGYSESQVAGAEFASAAAAYGLPNDGDYTPLGHIQKVVAEMLQAPMSSGTTAPEGYVTAFIGAFYALIETNTIRSLWRKRRGTDAFGWECIVEPRVPVDQLVDYYAFGDSFTQGDGASGVAKRYVQILGATITSTITNRGIGARGVYRACREIFVYLPILLRSRSLVTLMAGYNDLRRGGTDPKTLLKIENCHRAFLACAFADRMYAADNVLVTQGGSWAVPSLVADGLRTKAGTVDCSGNALEGTAGATLEYTFTDDSLVVGTWVSDGVTYNFGAATITIDGVLVETFDPNNQTDGLSDNDNDNGRVPSALVFTGLGSGSHTVVVGPTDPSRPFIVDYFGHLKAPENAQPVIVAGPSQMLESSYALSPPYNNATDAVMAAGSDAIRQVCDEFPLHPLAFLAPNSYFDVANTSSDLVHPDDAGHLQLAQGFLSKIAPALKSAYKGVGANSTAVGQKSQATGVASIGVGEQAVASADQAAAFGYAAEASASGGHAIGIGSEASGIGSTALGYNASSPGNNSVALGKDASAGGSGSTAIGVAANAAHNDSTAVGKDATTTKINEVMLGKAGQEVHVPGVLSIVDGMAAPSAAAGRALLFIDSADGDFKIIFADGTTKTIVTDT